MENLGELAVRKSGDCSESSCPTRSVYSRRKKRLICCLIGWSVVHMSSASTNGDRRDGICTLSD
jgi:hypothetical protein